MLEAVLFLWRFVKFLLDSDTGNLCRCQWWQALDLVYLRVSSAFISYLEPYISMSNSNPHATNMGRLEPEPASIHHSSNPVRPALESRVCHSIHISQFSWMSVVRFPVYNLLCLIYFAVVGDPPHPGFKGCLLIQGNNYYLLGLWFVVIIWDTRKYI